MAAHIYMIYPDLWSRHACSPNVLPKGHLAMLYAWTRKPHKTRRRLSRESGEGWLVHARELYQARDTPRVPKGWSWCCCNPNPSADETFEAAFRMCLVFIHLEQPNRPFIKSSPQQHVRVWIAFGFPELLLSDSLVAHVRIFCCNNNNGLPKGPRRHYRTHQPHLNSCARIKFARGVCVAARFI